MISAPLRGRAGRTARFPSRTGLNARVPARTVRNARVPSRTGLNARVPARAWALLGLTLVLAIPRLASAHAILVAASPAAKSTVQGPDLAVRLRFNSRIDGARSHLSLRLPDKTVRDLPLDPQDAPEVLAAHAKGLAAGAYRLRWQVLAADGHITRGEIPFQVK